jgi:general secretion pathway protein E
VGVLAQRLVRVLCPHCKEPYTGTPYELEQLGIDPARTRRRDERKLSAAYVARTADGVAPYEPVGWRHSQMPRFYRAKGCPACDQKGFTGRLGIYELLLADDAVGEAVLQRASRRWKKWSPQPRMTCSMSERLPGSRCSRSSHGRL